MFMKNCLLSRLLQIMLPVAAAVLLAGCMGNPSAYAHQDDVTSKPAWWGHMHLNEVLELKRDALLDGGELWTSAFNDQETRLVNVTVDLFKANPGKYRATLHLLPKGTKFRCIRLIRWFHPVNTCYYIDAEILEGECKGHVVGVAGVWGDPRKKGSLMLGTNSLLRPVE